MFNRLPNIIRKSITFYFDNEPIEALEGDTIASALLSAGVVDFRKSALSLKKRGPVSYTHLTLPTICSV